MAIKKQKNNRGRRRISPYLLFPGLALLAFSNITWLLTGGIEGNNQWLDPFMFTGATLTIFGVGLLIFRGDW